MGKMRSYCRRDRYRYKIIASSEKNSVVEIGTVVKKGIGLPGFITIREDATHAIKIVTRDEN